MERSGSAGFSGVRTSQFAMCRSASGIERADMASECYKQKALDLIKRMMTAQDPNVIDRETLKRVALNQRKRFFGCMSLPVALLFFMIFSVAARFHEDITNVYLVESGLREWIGGDKLYNIETIAQIWEWIDNDLLPKVFVQTDMYGSKLPQTEWSRVLMYNQLQGALAMEQQRSQKMMCSEVGKLQEIASHTWCYPASKIDDSPFGRPVNSVTNISLAPTSINHPDTPFSPAEDAAGRRLRLMRPEIEERLPKSTAGKATYAAYLYPDVDIVDLKAYANYLRQRRWLDAQTNQLTIKILLLNPEVGRPRLEQVKIVISFSRGGGMYSWIRLESLFLQSHDGQLSIFVDLLWVMMLMVNTVWAMLKFCTACKIGNAKSQFFNLWQGLEWVIVVIGWGIVGFYALQSGQRASTIKALNEVVRTKETPALREIADRELHETTETMVQWMVYYRVVIAQYHLILMLRFFSAFHSQPRLAVVTSTLQATAIDLAHFLVVFFPTFIAYAISGLFIFGRRMEEFATPMASIGSCFKIAMEGEFDWQELSAEHFWTAVVWVWSFMLLIVLLMLNMVLAIIMDVYTEVRTTAGSSETVLATLKFLFKRMWYARKWILAKDLIDRVNTMSRHFTREELLKEFPTMCEPQIESLTNACRHHQEVESLKDMAPKDTMKMTMAVKLSVDKVTDSIKQMCGAASLGSDADTCNSEVLTSADGGWIQEISDAMAVQNHWMLSIQWQLQQLQWQWQAIEAVHGSDIQFAPPPQLTSRAAEEQIVL